MLTSLDYFASHLSQARHYEGYIAARCPYHDDKKPSLLVFDGGWFRCLACGKSGSHEQLRRKMEGVFDTYTYVTDRDWQGPDGVPRDYHGLAQFVEDAHHALTAFPQLQWYLDVRGVGGRAVPNNLGWYNGWYVIPAYSKEGVFTGAVLRAGKDIEQATGLRYYIPPGQAATMFVPDWYLWSKAEVIAIVFGIFDALALAELRFAVATTTGNKFTFRSEWVEDERKPIVIIPDQGEEPEALKLQSRLGWRGQVFRIPYDDDTKDPADYLRLGRGDKISKILSGVLT